MALTKDEQRTIDMYNRNELKYYFCRIVSIQVNSTTSPFYYQTALIVDSKATIQNEHIEYYIGEDKSQITPSKSDIAKEMIKDKITDWFSLTLMRMYFFEDKTYREISEEINIPTSTIYANIRKSINKVKENINI
jgi:DNA-directed RNA polymerase specialized sigma subunit